VVHVRVAEVVVIPLDATALIAGIVTRVGNVKLADVAVPPESAETTAKLYAVPGVRPVSVTECDVTIDELSAESDP
jgi:hypothetical protein